MKPATKNCRHSRSNFMVARDRRRPVVEANWGNMGDGEGSPGDAFLASVQPRRLTTISIAILFLIVVIPEARAARIEGLFHVSDGDILTHNDVSLHFDNSDLEKFEASYLVVSTHYPGSEASLEVGAFASAGLVGVTSVATVAQGDLSGTYSGAVISRGYIYAQSAHAMTMTPGDPSLLGKRGKLVNYWTITGNLASSGSGDFYKQTAAYGFSVDFDAETVSGFPDASSYGHIQGGVLTNPPERELDVVFNFTWGETYSVAYSAHATTFLQPGGVMPSSASISAAFGNTFRWGGLTVTDLDGNPITDFQALDGNGKDWSQPLSVPEPGTASMALFGIAMFGFTRRRK